MHRDMSLRAITSLEWQNLFKQKLALLACLKDHGSPLNVLSAAAMSKNILLYKTAFNEYHLSPHIFYAAKCNKSNVFMQQAHKEGIGIEVSSINELEDAISCGFDGSKIIVSGPIKSESLLLAAIESHSVVSIDDLQEIEVIEALGTSSDKPVSILIRIRIGESRFGIPYDEIRDLIRARRIGSNLTLMGFSFHINNYSIRDRARNIRHALRLIDESREHGHSACNVVDTGGGLTINYVEQKDWAKWLDEFKQSRVEFLYNHRPDGIYPYHNQYAKDDFLRKILDTKSSEGLKLGDELSQRGVQLYIEPGRSLLDQCGITIFKIQGIKHFDAFNMLIVDGNINSLSEQWFGSEFLVDPILITTDERRDPAKEQRYCIAGNLCLESDVLARRFLSFSYTPRKGDYIAFINTAGYQMDSNESAFERLDLPEKVEITNLKSRGRNAS